MKMKIGNSIDSFSKSLQTCKEREIEKTKWVNENIVKHILNLQWNVATMKWYF